MGIHACTVLGWFAGAGGSNDGEPVATAMAALDGVAPPPSATPAWYVQLLTYIDTFHIAAITTAASTVCQKCLSGIMKVAHTQTTALHRS
jgi:hypothetical protein